MLLKFNFVQTPSAPATSGEVGGRGRRGGVETNNKFYRSSTACLAFHLQEMQIVQFSLSLDPIYKIADLHTPHQLIVPTFSDETFRFTISMMAVVLMGGGEEGLSDL